MMAEVHLVQGLKRQRPTQPSIEEGAAWEDPSQLLESFVDGTLEHRLVGHRVRASYAAIRRLHVSQMPLDKINVDVSCLETWVR